MNHLTTLISRAEGGDPISYITSGDVSGDYRPGDIVPWHFSPGLVVASFFASMIGTTLTVELLHRKRLGKSWASRFQILSCAASMGLVGIWCMHFIGNRSIILGDGSDKLQMTFSPGFTILSCILPVVGLSFAFYIAEIRIKNNIVRRCLDVLTGLIAGLSIVGMHYVGNLGTSNYNLMYPIRFIMASSIIAIGDCIIALMLFFYFKEQWINVFWKRVGCALLLAVAVCGMHYCASVGAIYRLKHFGSYSNAHNVAVILAGVLCIAAALICLMILFYVGLRNRKLANKAQQINIACAYFDDDGNILVTNEGVLPTQKIAKRFKMHSFDDEFSTSHPVFHWLWKVSNCWDSVADLIPRMSRHVRHFAPGSRPCSRPGTADSVGSAFDEESHEDHILFRESFCVAAADLAEQLNVRLNQLGNLYDRVISTGVVPSSKRNKKLSMTDIASLASSGHALDKGQILFFAKHLTTSEIDHFMASGYRLAPPSRIEAMTARTMQIPIQFVASHVSSLRQYAKESSKIPAVKQGTYLSCFAALGRVSRQFDVLVSKSKQDELPDVQLSSEFLSASQISFLKQYDGWTLGKLVVSLKERQMLDAINDPDTDGDGDSDGDSDMPKLVIQLNKALTILAARLPEAWFKDLIFNARPIIAQYGSSTIAASTMILSLTKLLDIHQGQINKLENFTFVPMDFFRMRTAFFPGSVDRLRFRSGVRVEFAGIFKQTAQSSQGRNKSKSRPGFWRKTSNGSMFSSDGTLREDNVSDLGLAQMDSGRDEDQILWGSIFATTNTVVEETLHQGPDMELKDIMPKITAIVSRHHRDQAEPFADQMYEHAKSRGVEKPAAGTY